MSTPAVPISQGAATVALPLDRAFAFFTESFGSWWPSGYHIGRSEVADVISRAERRRALVRAGCGRRRM
ncbi:hypothetical protein [Nocardia miyunensis]|uniref:hypothetical protein n=1 Tax=Nocardia miyunensis TaxID=282684 RepID=UPI000A4FBDDF|nr:hypothetical protein [Nocardia miyunensis]